MFEIGHHADRRVERKLVPRHLGLIEAVSDQRHQRRKLRRRFSGAERITGIASVGELDRAEIAIDGADAERLHEGDAVAVEIVGGTVRPGRDRGAARHPLENRAVECAIPRSADAEIGQRSGAGVAPK
ncbi:MAG: hypothetical protein R2845_08680 [Thermomicrobiales bacterium]